MRRDSLAVGIELERISAETVEIAEERILVPRKGEYAYRYGDTYVDAHHTAVRVADEFSCIISVLRINYRAVGKWI